MALSPQRGKRLFITGIPTGGKSYLAKKLAAEVGGKAVLLDDFRESLVKDSRYEAFVNFYLNQDEKEYLTKTPPEKQWRDLVAQSEGLWPAFLEKIEQYKDETRPVIFECVNILPHLASHYTDFSTVCLIGSSLEETLTRNIKDPRWGNTRELQELEAKHFFEIERPYYKSETERYGYPVFESADTAFQTALKFLR